MDIYATQSAFAALRTDGSIITWGNPEEGGNYNNPATFTYSSIMGTQNVTIANTIANLTPSTNYVTGFKFTTNPNNTTALTVKPSKELNMGSSLKVEETFEVKGDALTIESSGENRVVKVGSNFTTEGDNIKITANCDGEINLDGALNVVGNVSLYGSRNYLGVLGTYPSAATDIPILVGDSSGRSNSVAVDLDLSKYSTFYLQVGTGSVDYTTSTGNRNDWINLINGTDGQTFTIIAIGNKAITGGLASPNPPNYASTAKIEIRFNAPTTLAADTTGSDSSDGPTIHPIAATDFILNEMNISDTGATISSNTQANVYKFRVYKDIFLINWHVDNFLKDN